MAQLEQQQTCKMSNATVIVHSDEFEDGLCNGFVASPKEVDLSTDSAIYQFLLKNILDPHVTPIWNAGYIVGAIRGLLIGPVDPREADAPQVQLGTLTLRLNNWRFREGFYTGQDNRQPATILTARELLHYVARYDPETKRYFLTEQELCALEDVLGQLVGYLCAALFPRQGYDTGPLERSAIWQEA